MPIYRQEILILLLYYLGYSKFRNWVLRFQRTPLSRFVMFHDILPEYIGRFEANLHFLKRSTNVVSLEDFFSGKLSLDKINVVITFDDGYKSWITTAVPILKKLKLPAMFFVSSGFVGLSKEDELDFMRTNLLITPELKRITGCLNAEDVSRIVDEGFMVGGHTLTHCIIEEFRDNVQLRYEITEDKMRLEKITGRKIEYFAYPFGVHHNPEIDIIEILSEAGYKGALITASGFNNTDSNPYLLHRELTSASTPECVFRARVYGNYDAVIFIKRLIRMVF